ncbi:MAG: hypothetical protein K9H49_02035 [Bacteroidales bacterium]|nr:hypothetical protein [Bacteroidales bacterium]MCF8403348.1 hypothetical protein [Bacteroidales bacterium]
MNQRILLTALVLFILPKLLWAQEEPRYNPEFSSKINLLNDYGQYKLIGEYRGNELHGVWKAINPEDSTLYKIFYFDNGKPIGYWTTYYPNGTTIRKSVKYDNDNRLVEWTKYWNDEKIVVVNNPSGISQNAMLMLEKQESTIFESELKQHTILSKKTSNVPTREGMSTVKSFYEYTYSLDIDKSIEAFIDVATLNSFTYSVHLFYQNGKIRREVFINNGIQESRISYIYSNNRKNLKRKDFYHNEKLIRQEYYNGKGELKKEKRI